MASPENTTRTASEEGLPFDRQKKLVEAVLTKALALTPEQQKELTATRAATQRFVQEVANGLGLGPLPESEIIVLLPTRAHDHCNVFSLEPKSGAVQSNPVNIPDYHLFGYPLYSERNPDSDKGDDDDGGE